MSCANAAAAGNSMAMANASACLAGKRPDGGEGCDMAWRLRGKGAAAQCGLDVTGMLRHGNADGNARRGRGRREPKFGPSPGQARVTPSGTGGQSASGVGWISSIQ
ncbi:hypothetical protein GCM10027564_25390 [Luteimonas notoginsengisoli]